MNPIMPPRSFLFCEVLKKGARKNIAIAWTKIAAEVKGDILPSGIPLLNSLLFKNTDSTSEARLAANCKSKMPQKSATSRDKTVMTYRAASALRDTSSEMAEAIRRKQIAVAGAMGIYSLLRAARKRS